MEEKKREREERKGKEKKNEVRERKEGKEGVLRSEQTRTEKKLELRYKR